MGKRVANLADMPRGGPGASCLDRLLQTDRLEYLDRDDVDGAVKRGVVRTLDRAGELFGEHDRNARLVLDEVAGVVDPAILELGAGHGALSRRILREHPTARVTASDIDPDAVARMASGELGNDPRATVRTLDATEIEADDDTFDVAVFALSFHHLPPEKAARVLTEATRVAPTFVIIDLARPPAPLHLIRLATMAPLAPLWPFAHDGLISSLRAYSPSALRELAAHAGVEMDIRPAGMGPQVAVARRLADWFPCAGGYRPCCINAVGEEVRHTSYSRAHRQAYRLKVQQCLDVFETMLAESSFEFDKPLTGMEIECNLVDADYQPAMSNQEVLASIADPAYQTELGAYNIEFNVPPRPLPGRTALELEAEVRASLNAAETKAGTDGAHIVMIGILPTLMPEHLTGSWMSPSMRYQALNDSIFTARGEDILIDISGAERLSIHAESIAPESACTSMQLHLQVSPADFADNWNAAQVIAGPQLAIGANSPYFFGRQLWAETRIELFAQATDTRPDELKTQGVRPRVWFGERWITSIFDLFEENVRYFPTLLPEISEEDPAAELAAGRTPLLPELRLHNGTVYRWNRPVYDVVNGRPHLRVENRVLPAGPTVVDMMANSAFYYGLLRTISEDERPLWTKMSFAAAHDNFIEAARKGMGARLYWPGLGEVTPDELVLRRLLPMADEGLRRWRVAADVRDRYLGVIEGRAMTGRNGSTWQVDTVQKLESAGLDRPEALAEMLRRYCDLMHSNEPVHTWEAL